MKGPIACGTAMVAALVATVTVAANAESFPQPGDPMRWYEPADTPQKKHAALMKEAGAALKEALAECKGAEDRRACEAQARTAYRIDVEKAQAVLALAN